MPVRWETHTRLVAFARVSAAHAWRSRQTGGGAAVAVSRRRVRSGGVSLSLPVVLVLKASDMVRSCTSHGYSSSSITSENVPSKRRFITICAAQGGG